jgi:hydrogenase large subunit
MEQKITLNVPLNRVEGDLEVRVDVEDGRVVDAWSSGIMYRGFEQILLGRGALDGLVITPRVCGICNTSHLTAAARALDMIAAVTPPPNAVRVRNVSLMAEHLQNDMRQTFLMFTADFANPAYKACHFFDEAVRRYEPFKGETVLEVIKSTKKILEIIAIFGGQWPHSAYMVPGGVVSVPGNADLLQCRLLLKDFRGWYEHRILGCSLERWAAVQNVEDLEQWLEESDAHRTSELGFFLRCAREIGLETLGQGHGNYLSYGSLDLPEDSRVKSLSLGQPGAATYLPAGFAQGTHIDPFDQEKVAEHVRYSWFMDYEGGKHPFEGETRPYASGEESDKYSWAKAPRYAGLPSETGPLAEMIIAENPLFLDLIKKNGPNVLTRQLARIVRAAVWIPAMETWLTETTGDDKFYCSPGEIIAGEGFGLTQGARGALGHWVRIDDGTIQQYQIVTPTAWNASPRDSNKIRGPWEEALVGTQITDLENPIELGHIVRSFDACLVCTVHAITCGRKRGTHIVGMYP